VPHIWNVDDEGHTPEDLGKEVLGTEWEFRWDWRHNPWCAA